MGDLAGSSHFNIIWDMFAVFLVIKKIQIFRFYLIFNFLFF
jgi:hypothetical protein